MRIETPIARIPLTFPRAARLRHAHRARLTGVRGLAWVTADGNLRDIVLAPGDTFVVDSDRDVLVSPWSPAEPLEIEIDSAASEGAGGSAPRVAARRALSRLLAAGRLTVVAASASPWPALLRGLLSTGAPTLVAGV